MLFTKVYIPVDVISDFEVIEMQILHNIGPILLIFSILPK